MLKNVENLKEPEKTEKMLANVSISNIFGYKKFDKTLHFELYEVWHTGSSKKINTTSCAY